jgi:hypothetical protein
MDRTPQRGPVPDGQNLENVDGTCFHCVSPPDGEARTPDYFLAWTRGMETLQGVTIGQGNCTDSGLSALASTNVSHDCKYLHFGAFAVSLRNPLLSTVCLIQQALSTDRSTNLPHTTDILVRSYSENDQGEHASTLEPQTRSK